MGRIAPLKTSFLAISMLGFLISALYIPKYWGITWAFAFGVVFTAMFIASLISMMRGPSEEQLSPRLRRKLH